MTGDMGGELAPAVRRMLTSELDSGGELRRMLGEPIMSLATAAIVGELSTTLRVRWRTCAREAAVDCRRREAARFRRPGSCEAARFKLTCAVLAVWDCCWLVGISKRPNALATAVLRCVRAWTLLL